MLESAPQPKTTTAQKQTIEDEKKLKPGQLASQLDMQQLREQMNSHDLKIQLTGTAPDDVAISSYLAALEQTGIMKNVRSIYTDHYLFCDGELRKFVIEPVIRKPVLSTSPSATTVAARLAE